MMVMLQWAQLQGLIGLIKVHTKTHLIKVYKKTNTNAWQEKPQYSSIITKFILFVNFLCAQNRAADTLKRETRVSISD
jgi:hypothetical protein